MTELSRESELRQATIMFADISGFTAMSERMHPEEVTRIMNGCFRMMDDIIHERGGTIDKFIGDCVMVLFGVPSALENAPLMALNTAIEMRNGLYRYNRDNNLAIPLDIHVGINTGTVLAGQVGSDRKKEFTVMGDAVNLASRIEGVSEKGQILVGPETFSATRDDFEYRALKPVSLKGKAEPVPVYEVLSSKEARKHVRALSGDHETAAPGRDRIIFSPLVGRGEEMNALRHLVTGLVMGKGGIVTISGEAGIGKSRLMAELKSDPAMKQVTLLEGRAVSMGRNLSFHPIIDLLKSWAGITEDDGEAAQFAKLDRAVRAVHPEEADEIVPFAATLMGMKLSGTYAERVKGIEGEALEKLIFKNIRSLLIRGTEIRPMVLSIEDLHWADTSSIELLCGLFRLADSYRILFILVFRPNYEETSDRIQKTLASDFPERHMPVRIEPLDEKETCMLIGNLLNIRGLPRQVETQIKERAGGNPFFIEEVVRSFIDQGAVVKRGKTFEVTEKIHDVTVPLTINEVLMGRIDRLDEETKNLVKTAAVIGRNFFHKIIVQVAGNVSDIEKRLSYLEDIQLIRERKRMDELEYLFKHALAQEAAYESILMQKRKELHLHVAQAIESVFNERLHEFYGMLAYHYSKGEDFTKSEDYMIKAGEEAMKASASSEALELFKNALKIYKDKYGDKLDREKVLGIEKNIAMAYYYKGQHFEAAKIFRGLLDYYYGKASKNKVLRLLNAIAGFLHVVAALYIPAIKFKKIPNERDKLIISLMYYRLQSIINTDSRQYAIEMFDSLKNLVNINVAKYPFAAGILCAVPGVLSYSGISFRLCKRFLETLKGKIDKNDRLTVIWIEFSKLLYSYYSGEWQIWEEFNESTVQIALKEGWYFPSSAYLLWQFYYYLHKGYLEKAYEMIKKLDDVGTMYDNDLVRLYKYNANILYLIQLRKCEEALGEVDEGVRLAVKRNDEAHFIHFFLHRSSIQLFIGDVDESFQSFAIARQKFFSGFLVPWTQSLYYQSEFRLYLFQLKQLFYQGDMRGFENLKKKALRSGKNQLKYSRKVPDSRTEGLMMLGVYWWLCGKPRKALRWWMKSIEEGERLGARLELSRTYFEVGKQYLTPSPDGHDVLVSTLRQEGASGSTSTKGIGEKEQGASSFKALSFQERARRSRGEVVKKILGLTPEQCLDKAEAMFKEMDLQWDLAELEKVKQGMKS